MTSLYENVCAFGAQEMRVELLKTISRFWISLNTITKRLQTALWIVMISLVTFELGSSRLRD